MKRTLTTQQVLSIKHKLLQLQGIWGECIGAMDRRGVVFFWGNSGNGKTSAVLSLCKELTNFGKVLYVSFEQGYSYSMQQALIRSSVLECGSRFQLLDTTTMEDLSARLKKPKSPSFIVIDSIQSCSLNYKQFTALKKDHPSKLFIFVSHADGRQPEGRPARSIKYDADLKIWVEGYTAFSNGRFIGSTGKAVIWEEGAQRYWAGKDRDKNNNQNTQI